MILNAREITAAWEISEWALRRLVDEGKLRRVRRLNARAYYPLSAVVALLGDPVHSPKPAKFSGFERDSEQPLAA